MVTRADVNSGISHIATSPGVEVAPIPKLPELPRRAALFGGLLAASGILLGPKIVDATSATITAKDAFGARPLPSNEEYKWTLPEIQRAYYENIAPLVDPLDDQPLIGEYPFVMFMNDIKVIPNMQYGALSAEEKKSKSYGEFINDYVKQVCEISKDLDIRPEVFLASYSISGQNIGISGGQKIDIDTYKAQVAFDWVYRVLGRMPYKEIQKEFANPDSYIFSKEGKDQISFLTRLMGMNVNVSDNFRPVPPFGGWRFLIPTIGSMDLEPSTYARGIEFIRTYKPEAMKYFDEFPEARNALIRLADENKKVESARAKLKDNAEKLLDEYPNILDDFFNSSTAEAAFAKIGVKRGKDAEIDFGDTVPSFKGYSYDFENGIFNNFGNKKLSKDRSDYVVDETIKHFADLASEDKNEAVRALMADQVFNEEFVQYVREKVLREYVIRSKSGGREAQAAQYMPVPHELLSFITSIDSFNRVAENFMKVRAESYAPISKLEYNSKFQTALAIATTRALLDDVRKVFPTLEGEHRNSYYWQMYFLTMIREVSGSTSLQSHYMRADIDPPYNNIVFLQNFEEYYNAFVSNGFVPNHVLPLAFRAFATKEMDFVMTIRRSPRKYKFGFNKAQTEIIDKYSRNLNGDVFSGAWRATLIGQYLGMYDMNKYAS